MGRRRNDLPSSTPALAEWLFIWREARTRQEISSFQSLALSDFVFMQPKPQMQNSKVIIPWLLAIAFAAVFAWPIPWPDTSFLPDTGGYADAVSTGRLVAHPPGYPFFVFLGRLFFLVIPEGVPAVQAASLFLYAGSVALLFAGFSGSVGRSPAFWLTGTYAVSWIPLFFSRSGTNHSADLFVAALMLLAVSRPGFGEKSDKGVWLFGVGMVLSAGLRLPSFLMLSPLFLAVLVIYRHKVRVWVCFAAAAIVTVVTMLFVVSWFGGWETFRETSSAQASGVAVSSILISGANPQSLMNIARTGIWYLLAVGPLMAFIILMMGSPNKRHFFQDKMALFAGLSILGPLLVNALYLSTHPGYLAVAIPGTFWLAALAWKYGGFPESGCWACVAAAILSCGIFFGLKIFDSPRTAMEAVANGLVLQYSRDGLRKGVWRPTAEWISISGNENLLPEDRKKSLDIYLKYRDGLEK